MNLVTGNASMAQDLYYVNGLEPENLEETEGGLLLESGRTKKPTIIPENGTNSARFVTMHLSSSTESLVGTNYVEPKSPSEDRCQKEHSPSQKACPSELHRSSTSGKRKRPEIDENDPRFWELSASERSKILRAKRNREAAHRSRSKNKARQELLEEETRKQIQLNSELCSLLSFLLNELNSSSSSAQGSTKKRKTC